MGLGCPASQGLAHIIAGLIGVVKVLHQVMRTPARRPRLCRSCPALRPRAADIDRVWPTLDITQHRPTTILLTLVDMRKVEAVEMPRGLEASAPVQRSIVRNLTAIERAFGRGIPRYLGDYGDVFDELMAAASARVPGSPRPPIWSI